MKIENLINNVFNLFKTNGLTLTDIVVGKREMEGIRELEN